MYFNNTEVFGFKAALRGMRNSRNSHDRSDSSFEDVPVIGKNDLELAQKLIKAGSSHSKFMRMIQVFTDADIPRYFWAELDTYHFGTKNSESTIYCLLNNEMPITENLFIICEEDRDIWNVIIEKLESFRQDYMELKNKKDNLEKDNELNRLMVRTKRLLPEGFLQKRTWNTNYAELRNIYFQRYNHILKEEWRNTFCKWINTLPYANELIKYN